MNNSVFGIISVVFGGISIFFFGSGLAFIPIFIAFIFAFVAISETDKPKWSGIVGASLAGVAFLMCSMNIMVKTGAASSLVTDAEVYEDEDWDDDDWDDDDWDDDWDDDDWDEEDWDEEDGDEDEDYDEESDDYSEDYNSGGSSSGASSDMAYDPYSSSDTGSNGSSSTDSSSSLADPYGSDTYNENVTYHLGDSWTVPGQWKFTITKVEPTPYSDELPDTDSGAVYYVYYKYENLGYVDPDGVWEGLYFDLSSADITDSNGDYGYSYPGELENYAIEAPVGSFSEGVSCIGVDTAGNFTIMIDKYDGNDEYRTATYEIAVK